MGVELPPWLIFGFFCLLVPVFMAYNGGATAATVDTIQHEGRWSPAGIGLLGSMDKIGMTMAAAFWGYMLQRCNAKLLLCTGLLVNAGSTLAFGTLRNPTAMCLAKLLIGFTESLQWVWAPLWIGKWATAAALPIWMNLSGGGVASGVGNGLGTIIAGFTTAQGYSYEFAFQIEATVLFLLAIALLATASESLIYRDATESTVKTKSPKKRTIRLSNESLDEHLVDEAGRPNLGEGSPTKDTVACQLRRLWSNPLFCRCAMAYASANYVNSALQFLWVRVFEEIWKLNKDYCVTSFLVISACSGALGIFSASCQKVDHDDAGRVSTLRFVHKAFSGALLGALVVLLGLLRQLHVLESETPSRGPSSLVICWVGLSMVLIGVTAVPGLLQIMCIASVEDAELRSFATGLAQGANNFLGFAMGPMIPQLVMDFLQCHLGWSAERALTSALFTALLGTSLGALSTTLAIAAVGCCAVSDSDLEVETDSTSISHTSASEVESCSTRSR